MENMARLKRAVVTGGAGFIGSHLVENLIKNRNFEVFVVDIKINPLSYFSKQDLKSKSKFKIVDIRDRKKIDTFLKSTRPNYIFHLAAEPIVEKSYKDPHSAFETNIMGTVNILESSRRIRSIESIIVASSDKAYGKTKTAYTEESPLKGDHPYDVSKSCADLITQTYVRTYDLPVIITRFGNVYGEGDFHFERIIPGICRAIKNRTTLRIRSDGTYVRDYLYVKDVVDGYLFLLKNFKRHRGEAFNFSSSDTLSVTELIKEAEKILNVRIPYQILNIARNEIPFQHLDDQKIRKLGWRNGYSLKSSLPPVLKWYKKRV